MNARSSRQRSTAVVTMVVAGKRDVTRSMPSGAAITDTALRGRRFFFRANGRVFHGLVGDRAIDPDPAMAEGEKGWRAERV